MNVSLSWCFSSVVVAAILTTSCLPGASGGNSDGQYYPPVGLSVTTSMAPSNLPLNSTPGPAGPSQSDSLPPEWSGNPGEIDSSSDNLVANASPDRAGVPETSDTIGGPPRGDHPILEYGGIVVDGDLNQSDLDAACARIIACAGDSIDSCTTMLSEVEQAHALFYEDHGEYCTHLWERVVELITVHESSCVDGQLGADSVFEEAVLFPAYEELASQCDVDL